MSDEAVRSDGTVPWAGLLAETVARLTEAGVDDAEISARRIVEEASGWDGAELAVHLSDPATIRGVARLDAMVDRRLAGEPLQYVVGRWSFRTLDLMVDRRVLIPRPETEEVAGWAIGEAERFDAPTVIDLGTGSGAIGLSVATEVATSTVLLTDVSEDALSVARANLAGIGRAASRVSVAHGSWFEAVPGELRGTIAVIVSNPPYVGDDEQLPEVVDRWEPRGALRSGSDGTRDLMMVVDQAAGWLRASGSVVLEMAPAQTDAVAAQARRSGFTEVEVRSDLTGTPRSIIARK